MATPISLFDAVSLRFQGLGISLTVLCVPPFQAHGSRYDIANLKVLKTGYISEPQEYVGSARGSRGLLFCVR